MEINLGDTVKLIAPFGLDGNNEPVYPDANDIGKYAKVTSIDGKYFNVELFYGAEYGVTEKEIEKITFYIVNHKGEKVAGNLTLKQANQKLDELMIGNGYWYIYGSDDNTEAWVSGGVSE